MVGPPSHTIASLSSWCGYRHSFRAGSCPKPTNVHTTTQHQCNMSRAACSDKQTSRARACVAHTELGEIRQAISAVCEHHECTCRYANACERNAFTCTLNEWSYRVCTPACGTCVSRCKALKCGAHRAHAHSDFHKVMNTDTVGGDMHRQ